MIGRRVSQKSSPVPGVVGGSHWPALPHTSAGYAEADTPIHTTVQGQSVRSLLYIVYESRSLLYIVQSLQGYYSHYYVQSADLHHFWILMSKPWILALRTKSEDCGKHSCEARMQGLCNIRVV